MRRRTWSIRSRILILLSAPLIPLVGMWIFSTSETMGSALDVLSEKANVAAIGEPATALIREVQAERRLSVLFVSREAADGADLAVQRAKTDERIARLRELAAMEDVQAAAGEQATRHQGLVLAALDELPATRTSVDLRLSDRTRVLARYSDLVDRLLALYGSISGVHEPHLAQQEETVTALMEAHELLSRQDALVSGMLAAGVRAEIDRSRLAELIGMQRYAYARATRYLSPDDQAEYQRILDGSAYRILRTMEDRLVAARVDGPPPIEAGQWRDGMAALDRQLTEVERRAAERTAGAARRAGVAVLARFAVAGGLGLVVTVALLIVAVRNGRDLIRRIAELRQQILEVATGHLPEVMARVRAGDEVDVEAESAQIDRHPDELGQLGEAFTEVYRTAITSAILEAELREGLKEVFLNIARRNQTLLHRQLSLLDVMERRVTDPADLEELFRIDHLAARMRRHAEDLIILAGAHPGRGWRNPVPIVDVMRAAVSEVEQFTRITVLSQPEVHLAGRAVSDVVHLLAELLENATVFSPADTRVTLSGRLGPEGFAVEIEDRGVGMPPDLMEAANVRLCRTPEFHPAHSSRLGHFVVARLAARHGITVTLRPSAHGGVTAVVLIPSDAIVRGHRLANSQWPATNPSHPPQRALAAALARGEDEETTVRRVTTGVAPALSGGAEAAGMLEPTTASPPTDRIAEPVIAEVTAEGLPLRRRQASLPPGLRQPAARAAEPPVRAPGGSPAEMRSRLSQFQAGTNRGRRDAAGSPPADDDQEGRS